MDPFNLLSNELLQQGYQLKFRVTGYSMLPTINSGDLVTVTPIEFPEIQTGDILLCRGPEGLIAHRVIIIRNNEVILRGDATTECDQPLAASQILGKVTAVHPAALPTKSVNLAITNPGQRLYHQWYCQLWRWRQKLHQLKHYFVACHRHQRK